MSKASQSALQNRSSSSSNPPKSKTLDALTSSLNEARLHNRESESDLSFQKDNPPIHSYLLNQNQDETQQAISNLSDYLLRTIDFNQGEILIKLGHDADGNPLNLSDKDYSDARNRLQEAADQAKCVVQLLDESKDNDSGSTSARLLVRRIHNDISNLMEVRIACAGESRFIGRGQERGNGERSTISKQAAVWGRLNPPSSSSYHSAELLFSLSNTRELRTDHLVSLSAGNVDAGKSSTLGGESSPRNGKIQAPFLLFTSICSLTLYRFSKPSLP